MLDTKDIERARLVPVQTILGFPSWIRKKVVCPFHQDRTPSMLIDQKGAYYCFGCGKKGHNALDFLVEMGIPFKEAVEHLINK